LACCVLHHQVGAAGEGKPFAGIPRQQRQGRLQAARGNELVVARIGPHSYLIRLTVPAALLWLRLRKSERSPCNGRDYRRDHPESLRAWASASCSKDDARRESCPVYRYRIARRHTPERPAAKYGVACPRRCLRW